MPRPTQDDIYFALPKHYREILDAYNRREISHAEARQKIHLCPGQHLLSNALKILDNVSRTRLNIETQKPTTPKPSYSDLLFALTTLRTLGDECASTEFLTQVDKMIKDAHK